MGYDGGENTSGEVENINEEVASSEETEVTAYATDEEIAEIFGEDAKQIEDSMRDPTLTDEQLAIVNEMEQNGEMEYQPSQLGETIVGGIHDRLDVVRVDMPYNDERYDVDGFIGQAQDQEEGLNYLTVKDFLENYDYRNTYGRSPEGTKAQQEYSDGLKISYIDDKMQEGKSFEQAKKEATEELTGKAALHNPDQTAGGNPMLITSKGDAAINSAIGSLWAHGRAEKLYAEISELSRDMTDKQKAETYLNVRIDTHSKS